MTLLVEAGNKVKVTSPKPGVFILVVGSEPEVDVPEVDEVPEAKGRPSYQFYTDGSAKRIEGYEGWFGGWGCALYQLDPEDATPRQTSAACVKALSGGKYPATNNEMEYSAMLRALRLTSEMEVGDYEFFSDSRILVDSIGQGSFTGKFTGWVAGWARKGWEERPNLAIVRKMYDLIPELYRRGYGLKFTWVAAHGRPQKDPRADPEKNAYADTLATKGRDRRLPRE